MKKLYQCTVCSTVFENESEARKCENQKEVEYRFESGEQVGVFIIKARKVARDKKHRQHIPAYDILGSNTMFTEKELEELFGLKR